MSEIANVQPDYLSNLPTAATTVNDKTLAEITTTADYLPYLQLLGSNSTVVKRGEQQIGWGLTLNKKITNLGRTIVAMVLSWRPKAMTYDPVEAFFRTDNPKFVDIVQTADLPNSGKGYGPEFLLWLPANQCFVTFFCGNKTARREAPMIEAVIKTPTRMCQLAVDLIESKRTGHSWHGPKTQSYQGPVASYPSKEDLEKWLTKFNNPPESEVESAEAVPDRG